MSHRQLYLDCDGVLADFDSGVRNLLGMGPGPSTPWGAISRWSRRRNLFGT